MKTIISLYPRELTETRGMFRPTSRFTLPAATMGSFSRLVVEDQYQSHYIGQDKHVDHRIFAEDIARDLVKCWAQPLSNNGGAPGVFISPIDNPTDEQVIHLPEFQKALQDQDRYMANMVGQADQLYAIPENRRNINEEHQVAAKYLRISGRPWQGGLSRGATKECPFCGAACSHGAVKCISCGEIIDQAGYEALKKQVLNGGVEPASAEADDTLEQIAGIVEKPKSALRPAGAAK